MTTQTATTQYTACNGINAAGLLHCPLPSSYETRDAAVRAAKRNGLTHTVALDSGVAFDLVPTAQSEEEQ